MGREPRPEMKISHDIVHSSWASPRGKIQPVVIAAVMLTTEDSRKSEKQ